MNFIVCNFQYLFHFLPLIIEGNRRGLSSTVFLKKHAKYCCPYKFINRINELKNEFKFNVKDISKVNEYPSSVTFFVEGCEFKQVTYKTKKVSFSNCTDFTVHYSRYIDAMNHVFFLSEKVFRENNVAKVKDSDKNHFIGLPKYDVSIDPKHVLEKFNIPDENNALILYPRTRDENKINLKMLYEHLKGCGLRVLVKSRKKDVCNHPGDRLFYDSTVFPHTTMELLSVSRLAVNFNSTSIEEIVMCERPVINFNIKPFGLIFPFLYEYDFCRKMPTNFTKEQIRGVIMYLIENKFNFKTAISESLSICRGISKEVLNIVYEDIC